MSKRKTLPLPVNRATKLALLHLAIVEFELEYVSPTENDVQRCLTQASEKLKEARNKIRRTDTVPGNRYDSAMDFSQGAAFHGTRVDAVIAESQEHVDVQMESGLSRALKAEKALVSEVASDIEDGTSSQEKPTFPSPILRARWMAQAEKDSVIPNAWVGERETEDTTTKPNTKDKEKKHNIDPPKVYIDDATDPVSAMAEIMEGWPIDTSASASITNRNEDTGSRP